MKSLIEIRYNQLKKILNEIGPHGIVLGSLLLLAGLKITFDKASLIPEAYYVIAIAAFCLLRLHLSYRKDRVFLSLYFNNSFLIYYFEYVVLLLPFTVVFLFSENKITTLFLFLSPLVIIPLKPYNSGKIWLYKLTKWIPAKYYEWLSGIRANFWMIVIIYPLGLILSHTHFGSLLAIALLALISMAFYKECEPLEFFIYTRKAADQIIHERVIRNIFIHFLFQLPHILLYLFFHHSYDNFIELLTVLIATYLFTAVCVVFKYETYAPNNEITVNEIKLAGVMLCLLTPITFIIPLIVFIYTRKKAVQNISNYCYD